jgi:hypothetical protein
MASIHKQAVIKASPEAVWDVVRDIGAVHTRFAPGFVTEVAMDGPDRWVTFANGLKVLEVIVDCSDQDRRLAYSVRGERLSHHNASFQVVPEGDGARLIWIADLLPDAAAPSIEEMMEQGLAVAKVKLDAAGAS